MSQSAERASRSQRRPFNLAVLLVVAAATAAHAQDLVTPVRVGRADAPLTLHGLGAAGLLAPGGAPVDRRGVHRRVRRLGARASRRAARVSVMPALEQHKAKLLLAAAAGRLPDVASIDSFWLPLF